MPVTQGKKEICVNDDCGWAEYSRSQMQREVILKKLREQGCRITKQRRMLLDIILEGDCSCCKEIYYKAAKKDSHIGAATVYRMVNTLEEMGAISRKNMYRVSCEEDCPVQSACTIEFNDDTVCELSEETWHRVLQEGLKICGLAKDQEVRRVELAQ